MNEEDFKKLRTEVLRKAGLVNIALRKKLSFNEALKINDITEEKFNLLGWEYSREGNLLERVSYVGFDDFYNKFTEQHEELNYIDDETNKKDLAIITNTDINKLHDFIDNYKIIMQMVQMFKDKKQIDTYNKNIVIELPYEDDKSFKASYRINKTINEQFKEFCKEHKEFTAKDLLSQALKEFMEKYKL